MRTEHSKRSYIIDGKDGVYRRNRVHLCPTTPEMSLEKSSSPASALNSHKLQGHMDTEKSQDTNRQNKLKQSDKATANQEGTWLVQRLRVQLLVSWTFVHVAKNLYLTIKETLRQRTEVICIIHLCFILFYLILFEREGCWYYIAMSPRVGWNCKGLETMYDMCVWPAMFF